MKITQFILTLGIGGAESVVLDYALELKRRGHDVNILILLPYLHNFNEQILIKNGISITSIYEEIFLIKKQNLFLKILRKPFRTYRVKKWMSRYLQHNRVDVLHLHLSLLHFMPVGSCMQNKTKLFFTCHNESSYYFSNRHDIEYRSAIKLIKEDNLQFFALHSRMAEELNHLFDINTTQVMYNPVDFGKFYNPIYTSGEMRSILGLAEDDYVIGHVGRFIDQKNHFFLIEIFSEILKHIPNAKLLLVGDGPLYFEVLKKCEEKDLKNRVICTGMRSDIPDLLGVMDVFIFPSKFEGLGIVLLEAQVRVPHIVTSLSVPRDIAITDKVCFVSLDDEVAVWADAVLHPEKFLAKAVNKIEDFELKNVVSRLEYFYDR